MLDEIIFFWDHRFFSWNQFHENFVKLVSRKKGYTIFFYFQVEFYWLLPFVYDDLSYPMWWMDRTIVGLYASRRKSGKFFFIFSGEKKPNYFLMLIYYYQSWIFFSTVNRVLRLRKICSYNCRTSQISISDMIKTFYGKRSAPNAVLC